MSREHGTQQYGTQEHGTQEHGTQQHGTQQHVIEPRESLNAQVLDMHRALTALADKVGSLDTLNQRVEACTDPELKLVLASQRDTTRRQLAMLLEWTRRRDPKLDKELREALFKAGPIAAQYHYDENI